MAKTKSQSGAARIHEIEGKKQKRGGQGDGMEIKDNGVLLGRIEQIEQGNGDRGQFIAQAQASQPEGWETLRWRPPAFVGPAVFLGQARGNRGAKRETGLAQSA